MKHGKLWPVFSSYCYYKTLFHAVLLRWHREMHLVVMNSAHVSTSCLAPRASFSPHQGWVPFWGTDLEGLMNDSSWSLQASCASCVGMKRTVTFPPSSEWLSCDLVCAIKFVPSFCPLRTRVGVKGDGFLPTFLFSWKHIAHLNSSREKPRVSHQFKAKLVYKLL